MSVTTRFGSSVKRNITRFGKGIIYKHNITSGYDPDTGTTDNSYTLYPKAFKTEVSQSEAKSPNLVGKEITAFLISGVELDFLPKTGDEITYTNLKVMDFNLDWEAAEFWNGLPTESVFKVRVLAVKEYWAGEEVAMYRLLCAAI